MSVSSSGFSDIYLQEHWKRQNFNEGMSFFPKTRETGFLISDTNSALRNSTSAIKSLITLPAIANTLINSSAVLGGSLGIPLGLSALRHGVKKGSAALSCGDTEGSVQSAFWGAFGAGYAGLSGVMATEGIMGLQGAPLPAAMTPAFGALGFLMYAGLVGHSGYGLRATRKFNNDLSRLLQNEGERGVIKWLQSQISLTGDEISQIRETAKDPDQVIANRLQKKWNALELRTSPDCATLIREKLPKLIENFDQKEAVNLIAEVRKVNFKERMKHILILLISCISIAAFIAMFLTLGPTSPFLFALAAVTWITVDSSKLHNYIGEKCWNWHSKAKGSLQEELNCQAPALIA